MSLSQVVKDSLLILPEFTLGLAACAVLLAGLFLPGESSRKTAWIAILGLVLALLPLTGTYGNQFHSVFDVTAPGSQTLIGPEGAFSGMLVVDKVSDFFKLLFILGGLAVIALSMPSVELKGRPGGEYYAILLTTILSACFLVSSGNFVMLILSLETLSLCSYVLSGYAKDDRASSEASIKYVLYGSVASGVMLFGVSYLYGMAGTLDLRNLLFAISQREDDGMAVLFAFTLAIGGLGFKVAAVPFHFWAPDVYQGSPTPVTAFLAVVSKAAGFGALVRIMLPMFAAGGAVIPDDILAIRGPLLSLTNEAHLPLLFWILAVATMTAGNLIALRQTDLKRLLAYSSIAHAGYLLMPMTVGRLEALEGMMFYLFTYMFMTLGSFLLLSMMINRGAGSSISAFRGLFKRNPIIAGLMVVFLMSLTGLPPTAGFVGKVYLFLPVVGEAVQASREGVFTGRALLYSSLAIIGALNSAMSLYYYWRVARTMILDQPDDAAPLTPTSLERASLAIYGLPVALLILNFGPVLDLVGVIQH